VILSRNGESSRISNRLFDRDAKRRRIGNFKIGPPEGKSRDTTARFYGDERMARNNI